MILLDTHAFIWLASDQRKLSNNALEQIRMPGQSAAISIVTSWEIALLTKRGRLSLPVEPLEFIDCALTHHQLSEIPLVRDVIFQAVNLPEIHNDPFDRILIAIARGLKIPLISKDKTIGQYPDIEVLW